MPINVFYLDDENALCEIFEESFSSDDVQVTTFVDADEAILSCKKSPPALFFIDYRLPGTLGDEVAAATEKSIPKVLVTGDISFNSNYTFNHVVSKPYDFKLIQDLIDQYL